MTIAIRPRTLRVAGYSAVALGLLLMVAGYRATWIILLIGVGALLSFTARMLEQLGRRGGWRWTWRKR